MSDIVHYNPDDEDTVDTDAYAAKFYSACGALTGYVTPLRSVEKLEVTRNKNEVTCKNCKKTDKYKNE